MVELRSGLRIAVLCVGPTRHADKHEIAPRLIASAEELEALATDDNARIRALAGWRREIFGELALRLKRGQIALAVKNEKILLIEHDENESKR